MDQKSDRTHRNFPSKNSFGNFVFVLEIFPFSHGTAPTLQKKKLILAQIIWEYKLLQGKKGFSRLSGNLGKKRPCAVVHTTRN